MKKKVFVCMNPVAPHWQLDLSHPFDAEVILVGWSAPWDGRDDGLSHEVAAVIARSLTTVSRVSFPISETFEVTGLNTETSGIGSSTAERLHARLKHEPVHICLLTADNSDVASRIFFDPGFPWQLQGQIALLLPPGSAPPQLDRKTLRKLMGSDWRQAIARPDLRHLLGLMRPGIDGAVAGIWSFDKKVTQTLLARLESEAHQMGFEFCTAAEDAFTAMLAN
jgi:hypothetical protein